MSKQHLSDHEREEFGKIVGACRDAFVPQLVQLAKDLRTDQSDVILVKTMLTFDTRAAQMSLSCPEFVKLVNGGVKITGASFESEARHALTKMFTATIFQLEKERYELQEKYEERQRDE